MNTFKKSKVLPIDITIPEDRSFSMLDVPETLAPPSKNQSSNFILRQMSNAKEAIKETLSPGIRKVLLKRSTTDVRKKREKKAYNQVDVNASMDSISISKIGSQAKKKSTKSIKELKKSKDIFRLLKQGVYSDAQFNTGREEEGQIRIGNPSRRSSCKQVDRESTRKLTNEPNGSAVEKQSRHDKSGFSISQTNSGQGGQIVARSRSLTVQRKKKKEKEEDVNMMTINQLKQLIMAEDQHRIRPKRGAGRSDNEDGSDEECDQNLLKFKKMNDNQKSEHLQNMWKKAYIKARAGANVLNFFNDLSRKIYLFGVSNNLQDLMYDEKVSTYIILPTSKFKNFWNIVNICLLLYTATYMPYKTAFLDDLDTFSSAVDWFVDALFFMDIIICFLSAYEESNGQLQSNIFLIGKQYIKSWFFLDVTACFPFQALESQAIFSSQQSYQKLLRLLRLPRLYRFIKLTKVLKQIKILQKNKTYNKILNKIRMNAAIARMVQIMVTAIIVTHLFACFWFLTSKIDDFNPHTWVVRNQLLDSDPAIQYLYAFYWSTQTILTVGYGDLGSVTALEMILSLIWMSFGVAFYSFIVGNYSSIISSNNSINASMQMKIKGLVDLSKKASFPLELAKKIKKFIENNYESLYNQDDEGNLVRMLPPSLRDEVLSNSFGEIIEKVRFFNSMKDLDFLWKLLPLLRHMKLIKGDILYQRGDHAEDNGKAIASIHLNLAVLKIDQAFLKIVKNQEKNLMEMILIARKKRDFHLKLIQDANKKKRKKERAMQVLKSKRTFMGDINNLVTQRQPQTNFEEEKESLKSSIFTSFKKKFSQLGRKELDSPSPKSIKPQNIVVSSFLNIFGQKQKDSNIATQNNSETLSNTFKTTTVPLLVSGSSSRQNTKTLVPSIQYNKFQSSEQVVPQTSNYNFGNLKVNKANTPVNIRTMLALRKQSNKMLSRNYPTELNYQYFTQGDEEENHESLVYDPKQIKGTNSSGLRQVKDIEKPVPGAFISKRLTLMDKVLISAFQKDKMSLVDIYERFPFLRRLSIQTEQENILSMIPGGSLGVNSSSEEGKPNSVKDTQRRDLKTEPPRKYSTYLRAESRNLRFHTITSARKEKLRQATLSPPPTGSKLMPGFNLHHASNTIKIRKQSLENVEKQYPTKKIIHHNTVDNNAPNISSFNENYSKESGSTIKGNISSSSDKNYHKMFKEHKKSKFSKNEIPKIFILEKDDLTNSDAQVFIPLVKFQSSHEDQPQKIMSPKFVENNSQLSMQQSLQIPTVNIGSTITHSRSNEIMNIHENENFDDRQQQVKNRTSSMRVVVHRPSFSTNRINQKQGSTGNSSLTRKFISPLSLQKIKQGEFKIEQSESDQTNKKPLQHPQTMKGIYHLFKESTINSLNQPANLHKKNQSLSEKVSLVFEKKQSLMKKGRNNSAAQEFHRIKSEQPQLNDNNIIHPISTFSEMMKNMNNQDTLNLVNVKNTNMPPMIHKDSSFLDQQLLMNQKEPSYEEQKDSEANNNDAQQEVEELILTDIRQKMLEQITQKFQNQLNQEMSKFGRKPTLTKNKSDHFAQMMNADPFLNDEEIVFYGDPAMVGLVQFNADMSHVALNIFETFTLFEQMKQVNNLTFENIQIVESQNSIINQRQDNIEFKLQQIEQQLRQIKRMKNAASKKSLDQIDQEMNY